MKFLWTNFRSLLAKFRTASLLNIAGLAVALAVAIVVAIQVKWDFTYDRGYTNAKRIFTYERYQQTDGTAFMTLNMQWPQKMLDEIPEVEVFTLVWSPREMPVDRMETDGSYVQYRINHTPVRADFLKVFTPEIIAGETTGLFTADDKIMISRKTAEKIFGTANVVGQTLYNHEDKKPAAIAAVYEDFPENQTIKNGIFSYLEYDDRDGNYSYYPYFLIDPASADKVEKIINGAEFIGQERLDWFENNPESRETSYLRALSDLYLHQERAGGTKQINTTLSLLAVGILVLVIAWINFINLAMAMAPSRVRSINIHRIFGIGPRTLRTGLAFEGVLLTLIALILALAGVYYFGTTTIADLFDSSLTLGANIPLLAGVAAVALTVAFLIGLYAARYSTGFDVAIALKSSFALSGRAGRLRNVLIVVQFTAAMALICVAGMVKLQHDYMSNYSWGFEKENVIYLDGTRMKDVDPDVFGEELKKNPNIVDWTTSAALPGKVYMSWGREFADKQLSYFTVWSVHPTFLRFFDVAITAGNDFPLTPKEKESVIFNEEMVKKYDLDESYIGRDIFCFAPGEVIGYCENVHFESLHEPLKPMAFAVVDLKASFGLAYGYYYIKITGNDIPGTIAHIEDVWKRFTDQEFDAHFLDDEMDSLYRRENNMARLIGLFGLITVIIAMMGVYGLIFFNSRYRTKEIAIRRVNGAEVGEVVTMLNRAMFWQLAIAFVLATAIALFVIRNWLSGFAYKASVPWWLFAVAGVVVAVVSLATVITQSYRAATANPVESLKSE